jgi:arginine decarboxylase
MEVTSASPGKTEKQVKPASTAELPSEENWAVEDSEQLYGINGWGANYFRISPKGNVIVTPHGSEGPKIDLLELTQDLQERGICVPILMRFPDITKARIELLANCFKRAIQEYGYNGAYCGVYPIKVNQERHLVEELMQFGSGSRLGLECGSKPELLVVLAMMNTPNALIVCNGYKDHEYIETALLAQKLGRNVIIVVDRISELPMIISAAKKFNVSASIGFRAKLNSKGGGKWVESSGSHSKFGLTPMEIVEGFHLLQKENMVDALKLLHFHVGSQIPSIQAIKSTLKEAARFYVELSAMGAKLEYIDVGGGLGVDYDGSGTSDSSTNYSEQEYANDVVSIIQSICDEKGVAHPNIITEAGRSLVAYHAALVFNILGMNDLKSPMEVQKALRSDNRLIKDLTEIYEKLKPANLNESYNDAINLKEELAQMFAFGVINLEQLAKGENLYWAIINKVHRLSKDVEDATDIYQQLDDLLADTYFCNFSVFQSVPDSWAVDQLFPIMPIHRLSEKPVRRAALVDLTCDSDGHIGNFISPTTGEAKRYLEVHPLRENEPYFMAVFLVGAYQEILGDLHNLFGDTHAVHVTVNESGYSLDHFVEGDTVTDVLSYVEYNRGELIEKIRRAAEESIGKGAITKQEAGLLLKNYEAGLSGYTYLEDP